MMKNLFIGLGGQGGRSLAALRRLEVLREKEFTEMTRDKGVKFDYLYIDSDGGRNGGILSEAREWTIFGRNVALAANAWILISANEAGFNAQALAYAPQVAPWLGEASIMQKLLTEDGANNNAPKGAGQKRRVGRLLFASQSSTISSALSGKVNELVAGGAYTCAFHIFATLGGGTGSGSIIDLVTFLRNTWASTTDFPIYLYLYISDAETNANVGFFYENQFAALRDINALQTGDFRPHMTLTTTPLHAGQTFHGGRESINQIILSTPVAECGAGMFSIPLDAQIQHIAESCFEKIYASTTGLFVDRMNRAISGEDLVDTYGFEPKSDNPQRSYRFAAVGIKTWTIPDKEIRELLKLDLESQVLLRWLYRNWRDKAGYVAEANSQAKPSLYEQLNITVDGSGINEAVDACIRELQKNFAKQLSDAREANAPDGLNSLEAALKAQISDIELQFVPIKGRVPEIVSQLRRFVIDSLERLFEQVGLHGIHAAALELRTTSKNQQVERERMLSKLRINTKEHTQWCEDENRFRQGEWEKITSLSAFFNKRKSLLKTHYDDCLAIGKAKIELLRHELLFSLWDEILETLRTVELAAQGARDKMLTYLREVEARRSTQYASLRDLEDTPSTWYEFDCQALDALRKEVKRHRKYIDAEVSPSDEKWKSTVENFERYNAIAAHEKALKDALQGEEVLWKPSKRIHDHCLRTGENLTCVLEDSIVEKLKKLDPENYRQKVNKFFAELISSGQLSPSPGLEGAPQPSPARATAIGLPRDSDTKSIEEDINKAFPANAGDSSTRKCYYHTTPYAIRVFSMRYWMPVHFFTAMGHLEEAYKNAKKSNRQAVYFSNIDPSGEEERRVPVMFDPAQEALEFRETQLWRAKILTAPKSEPATPILTEEKDDIGRDVLVLHRQSDLGLTNDILNIEKDGSSYRTVKNFTETPSSKAIADVRKEIEAAIHALTPLQAEALQEKVKAVRNDLVANAPRGASDPAILELDRQWESLSKELRYRGKLKLL